MTESPFGPVFPAVALAAALAAIVAGPDYAVSAPAAIVAVVFAALTMADAVGRSPPAPRRTGAPAPIVAPAVGAWWSHGRTGREEIVLAIDKIERGGDRPELPTRPAAELAAIARLPDEQFLAYLTHRLDAIEGVG